MLCWSPVTSVAYIGVTRDYLRLEPGGFGCPMECSRSWLIWIGMKDGPPQCCSTSLVGLRQIQTALRIGELHLVLGIVAATRLFPLVDYRWWPVVGGGVDTHGSKVRSM